MEYRDLIKKYKYKKVWNTSFANELGRLAEGIREVKGISTIHFTAKTEFPKDRLKNVTYGRIVVTYEQQKKDPNRSRLTVGGDRITCPFDISTPTANLPTIKMLWNSVLSTPGSKFFTVDIANFYLSTLMDRPEFMRFPMKIIPQEIIDKYNLEEIATNGWVY